MSRIFLISDQPVLLHGFEHVLTEHKFEIAGSCAAGNFAANMTSGATPDVLLLDITAGLTFTDLASLHRSVPDTPVVLWADALPLELMFKTLEYGVRGVVQRNVQPEQLVESLRKVAAGELQMGLGVRNEATQPRHAVSLTPREREIVALLRQGMRNKQIAGEMGITEGTVKIYLFRLFHKLGVRNRFELARCSSIDHLQLTQAPPMPVEKQKSERQLNNTVM